MHKKKQKKSTREGVVQMTKKRAIAMTTGAIRQLWDPYYQGFAAQLAFYFLMSIMPMMVVLSQLLGLFSVSLGGLSSILDRYMSEEVAKLIMHLVEFQPARAMNMVFIGLAVWAASRANFALLRIANYTLTGGKSTGKGFFKDRLRSILTMGLMLITIALALIILVYGELLLNAVFSAINLVLEIHYEISKVWLFIRWPIALVLYFCSVSYIYYIVPTEKLKMKQVVPGSIFSAVGMLVITLGYKFYTDYATNYDILYGSLSAVVAVMMWFYLLAWALVLGIVINKVAMDTAEL